LAYLWDSHLVVRSRLVQGGEKEVDRGLLRVLFQLEKLDKFGEESCPDL